jgi:hypothetical protein
VAEEISVPPEVLETLLKIKRIVDAIVGQVETLQVAPGTSAIVRPATVEARAHVPSPVVGTFSATLPPLTASFTGHVSETPKFELPTVPEVNMLKAWAQSVDAAKQAALGITGIWGLIEFAKWIIDSTS